MLSFDISWSSYLLRFCYVMQLCWDAKVSKEWNISQRESPCSGERTLCIGQLYNTERWLSLNLFFYSHMFESLNQEDRMAIWLNITLRNVNWTSRDCSLYAVDCILGVNYELHAHFHIRNHHYNIKKYTFLTINQLAISPYKERKPDAFRFSHERLHTICTSAATEDSNKPLQTAT